MKRVLLVYDDFNEITLTESLLKKVGFDVIGITNEYSLAGQLLSFNPDLVIAFGASQKVNTISTSIRLKDAKNFAGKVILILPAKVKPAAQDILKMRMDLVLESPVNQELLVRSIAEIVGRDEDGLIEKLRKFAQKIAKPAASDRVAKYEALTKDLHFNTQQSSHSKSAVKDRQKEMSKDWKKDELDAQDRLRREFTEALFTSDEDAKKKAGS